MSFDPKILSSDESSFEGVAELELPDDLMQLADQLCDDAAFLADRYSPECSRDHDQLASVGRPASDEPRRRRVGKWVLLSSLASILLLLAMIPKSTVTPVAKDSDNTAVRANDDLQSKDVVSKDTKSDTGRENLVQSAPRDSKTTESPLDSLPIQLLHGASGPEQEAILDLIQHSDVRETVLSI